LIELPKGRKLLKKRGSTGPIQSRSGRPCISEKKKKWLCRPIMRTVQKGNS